MSMVTTNGLRWNNGVLQCRCVDTFTMKATWITVPAVVEFVPQSNPVPAGAEKRRAFPPEMAMG